MTEEGSDKGVWLTITVDKVPKLVQVIRPERTKGRTAYVVTEDGELYIERMARRGCVLEDIAEEMGVNRQTLYSTRNKARVEKAYRKGVSECNNRLHAAQVSRALDGNSALLIWLGKVRLGQREAEAQATSELAGFVKAMQGVRGDPEEER